MASIEFSYLFKELSRWLSGNSLPANAGDVGLIPGLGRSPGGGNGNPLQYSHLENLMDRGAWQATVHWAAKSPTRLKRLSMHKIATSYIIF